jgi:hypothetical protein
MLTAASGKGSFVNLVLGVVVLIVNGQIVGAHAMDAFTSVAECHKGVTASVKAAGPPPEGMQVAALCLDLSDEIKAMKQAPKAQPMVPGETDL